VRLASWQLYMAEAIGGDEADSVRPAKHQQSRCSDAESAGVRSGWRCSVASIHSRGRIISKRTAGLDNGPAESAQSTPYDCM
jgi:hypothetical protein